MPSPNKTPLTIIVNGTPTVVDANLNAPLRTVIEPALQQTDAAAGQSPDAWELRDASGVALDLDRKIRDLDLGPGDQLFLNLRAGIGG